MMLYMGCSRPTCSLFDSSLLDMGVPDYQLYLGITPWTSGCGTYSLGMYLSYTKSDIS